MNTAKLYELFVRFRKFISKHFLAESYVSDSIHQTIIVLALLLALRDIHDAQLEIIVILIVSVMVIQFSANYARILGNKISKREKTGNFVALKLIVDLSSPTKAVVIPVIVFLISMTGLISLETAFNMNEFLLICILFVYGFLSGKLSDESILKSITMGIGTALVGVVLVIIRTVVN